MLGEFFAAREDQIDEALVAEGAFERFGTIEAKTISSVSIATLGEIVGVGTYDELFDRADAEARQAEDGESGIDAVLPELQQALGRAEDLDSVARQWAATDELADWWRPDDVLAVVRELADMARRAQEDGRRVWFWWSL